MGKGKRKRAKLQKHHNRAKSRGGNSLQGNIFYLTSEHHSCYHKLFGNRTFLEASIVLKKLAERGKFAIIIKGGDK